MDGTVFQSAGKPDVKHTFLQVAAKEGPDYFDDISETYWKYFKENMFVRTQLTTICQLFCWFIIFSKFISKISELLMTFLMCAVNMDDLILGI